MYLAKLWEGKLESLLVFINPEAFKRLVTCRLQAMDAAYLMYLRDIAIVLREIYIHYNRNLESNKTNGILLPLYAKIPLINLEARL